MVLGGWLLLLLTAGTVSLPATPSCQYLVRGDELLRLGPHPTKVGDLPAEVNAIAYAPDQGLYYGLSGHEIVTITADGHLTWLGAAPAGVGNADAGAILDNHWLLTGTGGVHTIDIAPESPTYLTTVRRVAMSHQPRIADWDVSPADGALYAVDTRGPGAATVIRIDPVTGVVTALATPDALPGDGAYGSVVVDAELTMHAFHNPTGVLFHLPLADPLRLTATPLGPPAWVADGAMCPRHEPDPPSPSPQPTPSPTPTLSPNPAPTTHPPGPTESPVSVEPPPFSPIESLLPSEEPPSASPVPTRSRILVNAPDVPSADSADHLATRAFFLGMLLPAIIVVARVARRRAGR